MEASMDSFVALYRGPTVSEARLVAASGDPALVAEVASRLLAQARDPDPVLAPIDAGRRQALRLVLEAEGSQ
jgi:hypothetical protein